ncbi:DUF3618 domain-containing protein [Frigoribacterium faeni]|uniref:DUF3618 domain-containing protein n=1 Tax=Frigoribacterium faeni TaxID=145483 RepID=A0A7W3JJK8_9MICO|nr:DUF3618 domain-containing protein [Frigoribacterium faeni]MBA8814043.1 hypothetical protein [Frigoribacterium faeni]BFF16051.1 hypothetical protein GCM10025699_73540 [Microbacterium flavescens]GEK84076.1 hypothetical protein FFA01_23850 [Frigoribacterium faeni]
MTPRRTDPKPDPERELAEARAEEARVEAADASPDDTASNEKKGPRPGASIPEIELDIARTREEFAATLDAIEDKLSVPAHARRLKAGVKKRFADDPKPVVAAAAAGAAGVAAIVAGVVKAARR